MQTYELFYMIPPSFSETEIDEVAKRVQGYVTKSGGEVTKENRRGARKLAYPIGQFRQAHFVLLDVNLEEKKVADLDQLLRREENVMRHLVTSVRPKTEDQIEGERRLMEDRSHPRPAQDSLDSSKSSTRPASFRISKQEVQTTAPAQTIEHAKPVSDDITELEGEGEEVKKKSTESGFLQESGKTKDINIEDLDKKIDEILEDDML